MLNTLKVFSQNSSRILFVECTMMWQEARKQERKIRGLLVDYKKRAERRKDYYEKIKADPTQFIQLHGRPCKIHLDPAVAIAADSPVNMMPWQGNQDILIDRFDVRAHLDYIPDMKNSSSEEELSYDERLINYERYRILVQNDFLGVSEEKFLQQLAVEEQFGPVEKSEPQPIEGKKKVPGAAIGYNYDEGSSGSTNVVSESNTNASNDGEGDDNEEEEDSDIDFDLCVDVNKIGSQQAHEMNACAHAYGMDSNDFYSFLTRDVEEAENLKIAREREEEKAMFSGRKSRRERRAYREKKLIGRKLSPPSYASRGPEQEYPRSVSKSASKSRSRSYSPVNTGQITYITSFGGDEPPPPPPPPPAQVLKASGNSDENSYKRVVRYRSRSPSQSSKRRIIYHQGSRSDTFSRGQHSRSRGSNSRTRRSRSGGYRSRSHSRRSRSHGRGRSRSYGRRSRSRGYRSRSRSRSSRGYSRRSPYSRHVRRRGNSSSSSRNLSPSQKKLENKSPSQTKTSPQPKSVNNKSKSPSPVRSIEVPAPPVITRYYGRRKNEESSSSELELSDSDEKSSDKNSAVPDKTNRSGFGNAGGRNKPPSGTSSGDKMTPQERLKRKMQLLLNKQYKADKRAERVRLEKAEQERQDREEEMREISIKMRRRERQKRHQYYEYEERENERRERLSSISSQSLSSSPDSEYRRRRQYRHGSRERTRDRDKGRDRDRDRDRERDKDRDRERDHDRDRDREADRDRRRNRDRGKEKDEKDKAEVVQSRNRPLVDY